MARCLLSSRASHSEQNCRGSTELRRRRIREHATGRRDGKCFCWRWGRSFRGTRGCCWSSPCIRPGKWSSAVSASDDTVVTTPANEADIEVVDELIRCKDTMAHADAGYSGAGRRVRCRKLRWRIVPDAGSVQKLPQGPADRAAGARQGQHRRKGRTSVSRHQASVRNVEVCVKGLAKDTCRSSPLFALANLWRVCKKLLTITDDMRLQLTYAG